MRAYHDKEWGVPERRDRRLFEFLILEGAQAGLSWETILKKRVGYRKAFEGFDPDVVAAFTKADVRRLLKDPGIVRNRLKVESAISNAQCFLEVRKDHKTFSSYLWAFIEGAPLQGRFLTARDVPAQTKEAIALSRDLRKRGFRFVGPTIIYAYMQAVGLTNDHLTTCFRYEPLGSR
jgi:DNA-3-methyladenine glycosylase I